MKTKNTVNIYDFVADCGFDKILVEIPKLFPDYEGDTLCNLLGECYSMGLNAGYLMGRSFKEMEDKMKKLHRKSMNCIQVSIEDDKKSVKEGKLKSCFLTD